MTLSAPGGGLFVKTGDVKVNSRLACMVAAPVMWLLDPLLRPDDFKLVVKAAGRDVTSKYAVA